MFDRADLTAIGLFVVAILIFAIGIAVFQVPLGGLVANIVVGGGLVALFAYPAYWAFGISAA